MSRKLTNTDTHPGSPTDPLTNEAARQRWDLFHRAIAHAKKSNDTEMKQTEAPAGDDDGTGPAISIVR